MSRNRNFNDDETNEYFEPDDEFGNWGDDDDDETRGPDSDLQGDSEGDKTIESGKRKKSEILGFLVIKKGKRKNDKFELTKDDVIIGRSSRCCDFVLDDEEVSRIHCRIRKDKDKNEFYFFDCGSTNGTLVNNEQHSTKLLKSHDVITLGENVEIVFLQV